MIYYYDAGSGCGNTEPEHVCSEINIVKTCQSCGCHNLITRDPRNLNDGDVYAYDPMCGVTYFITAPPAQV